MNFRERFFCRSRRNFLVSLPSILIEFRYYALKFICHVFFSEVGAVPACAEAAAVEVVAPTKLGCTRSSNSNNNSTTERSRPICNEKRKN